ncbi:MAG: hypothetical protein ACREDX_09095 [Aestuariivirga sp.]
MARLAVVSGVILCFLGQAAMAGQTSASFQAGITIGQPARQTLAAPPAAKTYTWGAAAISVTDAGFVHARRVEKSPALYWFEAKRGGANFRIAVSLFSGAIVKVIPA